MATTQKTKMTARRLAGLTATAALIVLTAGIVPACDDTASATGTAPEKSAPGDSVEETGLTGKVASIRSAMGGIDGLSAQGTSGQRSLAPGDDIANGETIQADAGLEAVIAFPDDTAMVLREGSRVVLQSPGAGAALAVQSGEVSISRPMQAAGHLPISAGGSRFGLLSGRTTVTLEETGGGRLRVEAGEVEIPSTRQTLRPGQAVRFGNGEAIAVERMGALTAAYSTEAIQPLVPEYTTLPQPQNLLRGIGTLSARTPGSKKTNERALEMVKHDVDVTIRDGVALTKIEEAFTNHSGRTVEATYKFLIPSGASITRLALDVNGRIEEGEVLDKNRAKRIFRQIVEDSVRPRDPALLEWERGSSFSMKIFPIKAGETRRVFVSYMEPMTSNDGMVKYVYPLGGPAGSPDIADFTIDADVQSPYGLAAIRTPLYPARVQAAGQSATVSFGAKGYAPSADFVLEYATREKPAQVRVATETEKNGQTYTMALVRPDLPPSGPAPATRLLLAVDTSYGTSEDIRVLSASTALELIAGLGSTDSFNVFACDSGCRTLSANYEKPNAENLKRAHDFLGSTEPGGASDILGAMEQAFAFARDGVPTNVVYLGDGVPTAGETDPGELIRILERTRPANVSVQTVGIGPNVDSVLLDSMAASLGGTSYKLSVGESPAAAAWNVARRVSSPGLRDVTIEWPAGVREAYPRRVGFVPSGSEIILTAALERTGSRPGQVVVRGTMPDGNPYEKRFELDAAAGPPAAGFISKLWAKEHIDSLQLAGGRDKEIVDISRRMRVASRLTSWIVLENERMYKQFKVQRTDAEQWDGSSTKFTEVAAEQEEEEAGALDDLDSLAMNEEGSMLGNSGKGSAMGGGGSFSSGARDTMGAVSGSAMPSAAAPRPKKEDSYASQEKTKASKKRKSGSSSDGFKSIAGEVLDSAEAEREPAPVATARPVEDVLRGGDVGMDQEELLAAVSGVGTTGSGKKAKGKGGGRGYYGCGYKTVHDVKISGAPSYGAAAQRKAAELKAMVEQRPLSRALHKRYVRYLSRLGDLDRAFAAAETWRTSDPMGTDALAAYADQIARKGDRTRAARIYASIAEIKPSSTKIHLRLAQAFRDLGEYGAAAGHYRAASRSTKKGKNEHMLDYLFCLAASGQISLLDIEAASVMADGKYRKLHRKVNDLLAGTRSGLLPEWPRKEFGGALTATLKVDQPGVDLDVAIVDPAGRRISGLWRRGASARNLGVAGKETLSVGAIWNGRYQILVSRSDGSSLGNVTGQVVVRAKGKRKTLPFTLSGSEVVVGQVRYKKSEKYTCGY